MTNSIVRVTDTIGNVCAIIINRSANFENVQFLTDLSEEFQLGVMKRGPSSPVPKHKHNVLPRSINRTSEFLIIRKGTAKITIWSQNNVYINTYNLIEGDCILLLDGYHEMEFNSECQLVEVKQGPYDLKLDKSYES